MRILVAPDKFKGSLDASAVARAIAEAVAGVLPNAEIRVRAMADGGEGTLDALLDGRDGSRLAVSVTGPLGEPVEASLGLLPDGDAVVEAATASGLALVAESDRDPLRASTRGAGELIGRALGERARRVLVGIGGTASTDGGTGAASALGWRFLDGRGAELEPGGGALARLRRIDQEGVDPRLEGLSVVGACDVGNPLLGPRGAARVFAPQKGAGPDQVERLEEGLERLAERIEHDVGVTVASPWGTGAGGGMGAGLAAFFSGRLEPGFELVARETGLERDVAWATAVITGEGRLDEQSLSGKVPVGVAQVALAAGVPCLAVVGQLALSAEQLEECGFAAAISLTDEVGASRARSETAESIRVVTERLLVKAQLRG